MEKGNVKLAAFWLLISIGYILHAIYHLSDLFFGIDIKLPDAKGTVPVSSHLFRIVTEVCTLAMVLATLTVSSKKFYWFSLVWACLLGVLNVVHLGVTVAKESGEISQLALLTFILAANIVLILEIWKYLKNRNADILNER